MDHSELRSIIRKNVQLFLADISPIVSIILYLTLYMGVVNSYFVFQILDKLSPGIINGEGLQEEVHVCVCHYMHWYLLYLWDDRLRRFLSRKSKNCRP